VGRRIVRVVPLCLLAAVFATLSLAQVDTTCVIAAWNLKGFNPIDDAKVVRLARALTDVDAEIIALAEVNPDGVVDKLILELGRLGACYQGKILDQTARQNLAILYKTGVAVTEAQLVQGSDDGNPGLRKALTADVRVGQFDFKIVVLHLKAGRSGSDRNTRTRQATVLAGFVAAATAGNEKEHTQEYVEGSLQILPLARMMGLTLVQYVDGVSDHLPLVARFRVTVDDD